MKFKMAAAAILNLLCLSILVKRSISGGSCLYYCKISFIYVNRRLSYCCLCKNPWWRPPPSWILFFVQYFGIHVCRTLNIIHAPNFMHTCATVNELWAINEIQNGGRRYLELIILSMLVKWSISGGSRLHYCKISSIYVNSAAELLLFVQKFKMAAAAILDFVFVQYFGIHVCRTSNVIHTPNFVQICTTVNKLWAINEI